VRYAEDGETDHFLHGYLSAEEERDGTGYLLLKKRNCTLSD
jgi:hypothetical protein